MTGRNTTRGDTDALPERFDDGVSLHIDRPDDDSATARMQDENSPAAWIEADVSLLASLPEYE